MKYLKNDQNGGFRLYSDDLRFMQEAFQEMITMSFSLFSQHPVIILSGCDSSINAGQKTVSDGVILFEGKPYIFEEQTYPEPSSPNEETFALEESNLEVREFLNGDMNPVHVQVKAVLEDQASPASGYMLSNVPRYSKLIRMLNPSLELVLPIGEWNMQFTASKEVLFPPEIEELNIISVEAYIYNNDQDRVYPIHIANGIDNVSSGTVELQASSGKWKAVLNRLSVGAFAQPSFNDTSMNRGYLIIRYME